MKSTQFKDATLTFLFKGKKRNIVDHLTYSFDISEKQVWVTEDRLLLNAMFHLITANVQPTKGKVINPIRKYYAIKPVPILNHFSLKQYLKTLLAVITPKQVAPKNILNLLCDHHDISQQKLCGIVEYLSVETQIALSLSLAILLDIQFVFIQNAYINTAQTLLPESLHTQWQHFLTKNTVISVVYNEKEPTIDSCFKRIMTITPYSVTETLRP
ncbi:hypothetical protein [Legionella brunensis]|uniref:hypothetical protein n=1 Tax=Legionella brunensis TaxID=29422 RepID=UPI00073111BA|nr:hypothetical protein [Legionella brunensis]